MKGTLIKILQGSLAFWVVLATGVHAAPGTLSSTPLIVTSAVDPNLMLLLDSSGSMNNIVPEAPDDATIPYPDCPEDRAIDETSGRIEVEILSTGDVLFRQGGNFDPDGSSTGTLYDWGTSGGSKKCFVSADTYQARLSGNGGDDGYTKYPSGYADSNYTGHYLNWYFSDATQTNSDNFGSNGRQKTGTNTRMRIAKTAAIALVNSMDNARLGLATYNGSKGALIREGLDDIANNKADIISSIEGITGSGSTPIAKSFQDIGRYFIQGKETQQIKLHPGDTVTQAANTVFSSSPAYSDDSDIPTSDKPAIQEFCQQNFLVALTDGRPQSDADIDDDLMDYDGDCVGASPACLSEDRKDGGGYSYAEEGSDYMDDVAQALYDIDLRPDLVDLDDNEVINNVRTYVIGFADDTVINDPLLQDTADQGGGLFITATNATSLVDAFEQASTDIFGQVGSAASVAFNSTALGTDSAVFFARFNTNRWNGELFAYPLDGTGNVQPQSWEASKQLDDIAPANRVVFTHNGSDGVNFQWSELSTAQQLDLNIDKNGAADTNGQARLEYLRGERSNEGTGVDLRIRNSRLGDIVDSTPVYVGAPGLRYPDVAPFGVSGSFYSDFVASAGSRKPVVYVGANDGMLHGFDGNLTGTGGDEVLAYVPSELYSASQKEGLHYLTSSNYEHRFYVNASPTVSDVFVKRTVAGTPSWRTVLIGGTGAGGQGIFALDVTDPNEFVENGANANAKNVVLWEFTGADDADLGATLSKPIVAMMNNNKWAVIFGNGYSNEGDTGDGKAKLFIVFIEEGVDGTWSTGDYIKIDTEVGGLLSAARNGLSSVSVADTNGDRIPDRIYGGDVLGNMWVFDVSNKSTDKWEVEDGKPLFTANQPITAAPVLVRNASDDDIDPDIIVLFGTGQYLTTPDITNTATQSFYGVWDHGIKDLSRDDLVSRTLVLDEKVDSRKTNGAAIEWGDKHGWYVDFDPGERVISSALVRGGVLFFNTLTPSSTLCGSGGDGFLMSLNPQTGLAPDHGVFDGDNDGDIDSNDAVYVGERVLGLPAQSGILGNRQYTPTSRGVLEERDVRTGEAGDRLGRLAWEELILD